jgi:glycosyltransferase involved in cell wall biosynthesis/SAM-dependent methyltransferase
MTIGLPNRDGEDRRRRRALRVCVYSDCDVFGGSENMLVAILADASRRDEVEPFFAYRHSSAYEQGVRQRIPSQVARRSISLPAPELLWGSLNGWPRQTVKALAYAFLVRQLCQLWDLLVLYRLFRQTKPDLVHVNNGGFPGAASCNAAAVASRLANVPATVYVANSIAAGYRRPLRWADYPLDRLTVRAVSRFVTGSQAAARALAEVLHLHPDRVVALANGIARGEPHEDVAATRARLDVEPAAQLVLVVSRLDPLKDHASLLEAFHRIVQRTESEAVLVIAGDGPEEEALRARVERLELASRVRFVSAPHAEIWALYAAAEVVVLPSLREDFPYSILEAMAMGKPVIGSAVGGVPEQIVDGVTGFVVPVSDTAALAGALEALLADPARRLDFGRAARARFEELFKVEAAVDRYRKLYDELLGSASTSSGRLREEGLATKAFWEDTYLADGAISSRPSTSSPFERSLMQALEKHAPAERGSRLLDIGCAPGKWMAFYAERFASSVEGIEYTERGAALTEAALGACGVNAVVHRADFWDFEADASYDLVLSLGFIEHWNDVEAAFARHVALTKPGGRIVVGMPNYQGVNRLLQRWFDRDWLDLHNLEAMGHRRYLEQAAREGVEPVTVSYIGGFDPDVISTRRRGRRLLGPIWRLRHRGLGDDLNGWWLSSYLLMVFRRSDP